MSVAESLASAYAGRRVLVTGHAGFKGGWLMEMLDHLGALPFGYGLPSPYQPNLGGILRLADRFPCEDGDVLDRDRLDTFVADARPEIVFHLAAQPLVRLSYERPEQTFATNVQGSIEVLSAVTRHGVPAAVMVTSDKVYRNDGSGRPFSERDPLGGHDPYSASKAMAELAIQSWRDSYPDAALVASVRAGNIIGGGDWSADRLLPDVVRAILRDRVPVTLRRPEATRPWQHVLDALTGYLQVGAALLAGDRSAARAWNFGPPIADCLPVQEIVRIAIERLGTGEMVIERDETRHEAGQLVLDTHAARSRLGWRSRLAIRPALALALDWYAGHAGNDATDAMIGLTRSQIVGALPLPVARRAAG